MRICRRQEALRAAQERVAQVALDLARAGAKRFAETEQLEQATRERVEVELVLERARERLAAAEERHDLACKRARLAHDIVNNVLRDFAIDAATAHEWLEASQASIEARVAHLASVADRLATARATRAERELRLSELRERLTQHHGEAECAAAQKRYWVERGEIDESHGDVLARLRSDDQAIARRDAIERASRKQREQVEIFGGLAAVIGSHDGAKLRRFAQSLTLDNLLIQANLHLRELAPRYRLQRVPGEDLELQVVDGDLGDEIRGVRSLSGGETFLVSLALALGLSSLSARNTRVESLLVDEGFGALDPDALETALAVLDALRATRRQVGLISHVPGLAERFCAQVVVSKNGAGLSDVRVAASA